MYIKIYFVVVSFLLVGCNGKNRTEPDQFEPPIGALQAVSEQELKNVHKSFLRQLQEQESVSIVAELDFTAKALEIEREVVPIRTVLFSNPELGTPLMQKNQLAGLDLPQKLVLLENGKKVYAMYNSVEYLKHRYELDGIPVLEKISAGLENMTTTVMNSYLDEASDLQVSAGEGIISVESEQVFDQTYYRLRESLYDNPYWTVVAQVDHQENAKRAGIDLPPTRLMLITNTYLDTVFLKNYPTAALDLPYKILVWEDENEKVRISYNSAAFFKKRHHISGYKIELAEMAATLETFAEVAATEVERYKPPGLIEGQ